MCRQTALTAPPQSAGKVNRVKEYRELDTKLQGINWTVDLL